MAQTQRERFAAARPVADAPDAELVDATLNIAPATLVPDAALLARERILPPNAAGPHGRAYKLLRTQVLQRLEQLQANTIAVISPTAGDGKTHTALNLAIAIAADLSRTALLVDCDLRNPSLHRRLGIEPTVGIEDCLQSGRLVHEAIVRLEGYQRLSLLPARSAVEHSSELLASDRTARLVHELRNRYNNRIIIFDLPPVLQADDALAFSRLVQCGLMVIGEGRTRCDDLTRSMELLRGLPLIGTVLNGSRESPRAGY